MKEPRPQNQPPTLSPQLGAILRNKKQTEKAGEDQEENFGINESISLEEDFSDQLGEDLLRAGSSSAQIHRESETTTSSAASTIKQEWWCRFINSFPTFSYAYGQELYLEQGRKRRRKFRTRHWSAFLLLVVVTFVITSAIISQFKRIGTDIRSKFSETTVAFNETVTIGQESFDPLYFYFNFDTNFQKDIWEEAIKKFGFEDKDPGEALCQLVFFGYQKINLSTGEQCIVSTDCFVKHNKYNSNIMEVYFGFEPLQSDDFYKQYPTNFAVATAEWMDKKGIPDCPSGVEVNLSRSMDSEPFQIEMILMSWSSILQLSSTYLYFIPGGDMNQMGDPLISYDKYSSDPISNNVMKFTFQQLVEKNKLGPAQPGVQGWMTLFFEKLNPLRSSSNTKNYLDYQAVLSDMQTGKREIEHTLSPRLFYTVFISFPPTNIQIVNYITLSDFFAYIGGYFSLLKTIIEIVVGFFIFQQLNHFMSTRLLHQNYNGPPLSEKEQEKKRAKMELLFRKRVSQEGLFYLHEDVKILERENKDLRESNEVLERRCQTLEATVRKLEERMARFDQNENRN